MAAHEAIGLICHTFGATGITHYLEAAGGSLENPHAIAVLFADVWRKVILFVV
jgi:hypothetical protein